MRSPGWKTRASSSTSTWLTSSSSSSRRLRLGDSPRAQGWWISLLASESLVTRPNPLSREHDLELFLATGASHGRGIGRVRRDVEMLSRDEARTDVPAAEGTRDLVMGESPSIDRDSAALIDLLHAASLGACHRNHERVVRRSRARRRPSRSGIARRSSRSARTTDARSSFRTFAASAWWSRSSRSRSPTPETAKLPR